MSAKNLPVYRMMISENEDSDLEVNYVALVDRPAIEKDFMVFSQQKSITFATDDEKRIITGPLMLADVPIFRKEGDEEYYVVFEAGEIMKIAQKFFQKGYQKNVNEMHNQKKQLDGLVMFESWLVDPERGISPMAGYEDAKPGSWFGSFKVNDEETWQKIKAGEFTGFSVEGFFHLEPVSDSDALIKELESLMGAEGKDLLDALKNILA